MTAMFQGQPILGSPGKDATINGVNTLELVAGENVTLNQDGNSLLIGSKPGEVYSTEETRIGTWIDGKPLYRTVVIGLKLPDYASPWTRLKEAIPNAHVVRIDVFFELDARNYSIARIPTISSAGKIVNVCYVDDDGVGMTPGILVFNNGVSSVKDAPITVILEYIKRTDP